MLPLRVISSFFCGIPKSEITLDYVLLWLMTATKLDGSQIFETGHGFAYIDQERVKITTEEISHHQINILTVASAPLHQADPQKQWVFKTTLITNRIGVSITNTVVNGDYAPIPFILLNFCDDRVINGFRDFDLLGAMVTSWVDYVDAVLPWVLDGNTFPNTPLNQICPFKSLQERDAYVLSGTGAYSAMIRNFSKKPDCRLPKISIEQYKPYIPKDLEDVEFPEIPYYDNRGFGFMLTQESVNKVVAAVDRRFNQKYNNPRMLAKRGAVTTNLTKAAIHKIEKASKAQIRLKHHQRNLYSVPVKTLRKDVKLVTEMSKTIVSNEFSSVLNEITLPPKPLSPNFKPAFEIRPAPHTESKPLAKKRGKPQTFKVVRSPYAWPHPSIQDIPRINTHAIWVRREEEREMAEAEALARLSEVERLKLENDELKKTIGELEAELLTLEDEVENLRHENHDAQIKAQALQSSLVATKANKNSLEVTSTDAFPSAVVLKLMTDSNYSLSVIDALLLVERLASDQLVVLDSAKESARALPPDCLLGRRLLNLLTRLVVDWKPLYETQGDNVARNIFSPGEYARGESQTVECGQKGDLRKYVFEGRELVMMRHLRIGTTRNDRYCIRIHFEYDATTQKIVIGHCGSHLEC